VLSVFFSMGHSRLMYIEFVDISTSVSNLSLIKVVCYFPRVVFLKSTTNWMP
jgi:hypothetical protein